MRIPPHFSDCIAFICERTKPGKRPAGTGFFVELEDHGYTWTYLVTALHNLDEAYGNDIYVRANTHPQIQAPLGYEDIPTRTADWFKHDHADVAAIISPVDPKRYAFEQIPIDTFIDARYRFDVVRLQGRANRRLEPLLKSNYSDGIEVQVGDETFAPGLFVQSAGKNRNLPVVRFGNVARMPGEEMILLGMERVPIRAYLVETHSWGGFSGAPMFWHFEYNISNVLTAMRAAPPQSPLALPPPARGPERIEVVVNRGYATALLGLVSGHYDIPTKSKDESVETLLNAGIATVTPAENIRELLMRADVVEEREQRAANMEPAATADFRGAGPRTQRTLAKKEKDRIDIPISTKRQFFDDLMKATRKREKK